MIFGIILRYTIDQDREPALLKATDRQVGITDIGTALRIEITRRRERCHLCRLCNRYLLFDLLEFDLLHRHWCNSFFAWEAGDDHFGALGTADGICLR